MIQDTPQANNQQDIPSNWTWATLGEISDLVGGGTPSRKVPEFFEGDIVWLTPSQIPKTTVSIVSKSDEGITEEGLKDSSAKIVPSGAVLMTSRASIGYVAVAGTSLATNQGFANFICEPGIYNLYLAYWLWSNADYFYHVATGTTFKEISKTKLRTIDFPLAPLAEQYRIVEAIEAQLTRLDKGVETLERLQANLQRYKASVLKAACEGRLVPQDPDDEPASELLERILAERRARWEEEYLAKQAAKSKAPKNDKWKEKYKEPTAPDQQSLDDLPKGWAWATTDQIADHEPNSITDGPFGSKLKTAHYTESGPRVVRLQNIGDGEFLNDDKAHISEEHYNTLLRHRVHPGDIVIGALGNSLPRSCIIPEHLGPAIVKADCMRFSPHRELGDVRYLNAALNSPVLKSYADTLVHGVGRPRLNQGEIKSLPIPLPPLSEQRRIAEKLERSLSIVQRIEQILSEGYSRAMSLRQAILKRAYEGKLVDQVPDDEPATELLARIRHERESSE